MLNHQEVTQLLGAIGAALSRGDLRNAQTLVDEANERIAKGRKSEAEDKPSGHTYPRRKDFPEGEDGWNAYQDARDKVRNTEHEDALKQESWHSTRREPGPAGDHSGDQRGFGNAGNSGATADTSGPGGTGPNGPTATGQNAGGSKGPTGSRRTT